MSILKTQIVSMNDIDLNNEAFSRLRKRYEIRNMSREDFIERHGSGTLRKNTRIGFSTLLQYKEERIAYEFGWGFKIINHTRFQCGDAISEGDSHSVTEAGWHAERYIEMSIFPEDIFEVKYITVEDSDGAIIEGIGLLCRQTSAKWIGDNNIVFAMIAEWDRSKSEWRSAENPF